MIEIVPLFRHDGNGNKNNYRRVLGIHCYQSKLIKSNYDGIKADWSLHHLDCNWKNNASSNLVFIPQSIHNQWHSFIRQVLLPMIEVLIKEGEIDEED